MHYFLVHEELPFCKANFDETSEEDDKFYFERFSITKNKIFQTAAFIRKPQIRTADSQFPDLRCGPDPRLSGSKL